MVHMAYTPTTEEGKKALEAGADLSVIEEMEKEGSLASDDLKKKEPEHVEKSAEDIAAEEAKAKADADAAAAGDQGTKKEDDQVETPQARTPNNMPVWKHKEEMKKAVDAAVEAAQTDFEKRLIEVSGKGGGNATASDVEKFAEEFSITPEAASGMIDRMASLIESRLGVDDLKKENLKRQERDQQLAEEKGFEDEFSNTATNQALTEIAGDRAITKEVKEKVKQLAYSTTYATYRLADIIRLEGASLFPGQPQERKTAEISRGGSGRGAPQKKVTEMSAADLNDLSDDEFMKLSNDLGKGGSKYQGITRVKSR